MKKIVSLLSVCFLLALAAPAVHAQDTKRVTKTITAADTITFEKIGSNLVAVQYTYTETSGTSAGKVYIEGTVNGTYKLIDSISLSDVATAQTLHKEFTTTPWLNIRLRNTNTSSATGTVVAAILRRPDERR